MSQRLTDDQIAQAAAPRSLFGPARPDELRLLVRSDWRGDAVKALLFTIEGLWLLAWTLFLIRWSRPEPFTNLVPFALGWLLLSALSLGAGIAYLRQPGEEEREGARRWLVILMVVVTPLWWLAVSGGVRPFLRDVGTILQLHPGPGFWTLWLAIITWARGLDWSQQVVGLARARATMHAGLMVLAILALLGLPTRELPALVPVIGILWIVGLLALGLTRLVQEDRALLLARPSRLTPKQVALVAGTALGTMGVGAAVLWLLAPERRAAISQWLLSASAGPAKWLFLQLLGLTVWGIDALWGIFNWIVTQIKERFGITFNLPPPSDAPQEGSADAFFEWLMALIPPGVAFALRVGFFILFLVLVVFLILTRLGRLRYGDTQADEVPENEERERASALQALLANLRNIRLPSRAPAPEPNDAMRRIYVRLVRLGEERGAPWRERLTPYEHESLLRRALPGHDADIHLITEQYVRVRYADEHLPSNDLRAAEAAFNRLERNFTQ